MTVTADRIARTRRLAVGSVASVSVLLALLMVGTSFGSATWVASASTAMRGPSLPWNPNQTLPNPATVPIKHVVIVVQENHAFDDFYGTYCQALGTNCPVVANGIPAGECVPKNISNPGAGCVRPFAFPNASSVTNDMSHSWATSHTDYANGTMSGFYQGEKAGAQPFGYYNGSVIPYYWDVSQQYGLGDNFFSGSLSYSLGNHWDLVSDDSPTAGEHFFMQSSNHIPLSGIQEKYLNQANSTPFLGDLLTNNSVSWKYYDEPLLSNYQAAINQHAAGGSFSFWNPLAAKASTYAPSTASHFVARSTFATDAMNGTLPNVSWVIPTMKYSDHPPNNVTKGQEWVSKVINSVERSPEWKSTAIFVTWDEFGGFYDHVAPPEFYSNGLGFRVPLLVISPYTPEGYVSHSLNYFQSIVHFVEWRWGVGNFSTLDGLSLVPIQYFDFNATARSSLTLANVTKLTYPSVIQHLVKPGVPSHLTATAGVGNVTLNWQTPLGGAPVTYYLLQYGPTPTPTKYSVRVDGANNSYLLTGLPSKVPYSFSVASYTPGSHSASANVTIAPMVPFPVPTGPNAVALYVTLFPSLGAALAKAETGEP